MNSAPPSYLPSKKSQLTSRSRIAKINELYERKKREHRDSVVSNSSTSVVSSSPSHSIQEVESNGIDYSSADDQSKEIQHQNISNPFAIPLRTSTPPMKKKYIPGTVNIDDKIVSDDDYMEELKFTPKLKSRKSIESMRSLRRDDNVVRRNVSTVKNTNQRKISNSTSIRHSLGDPLPLPYIRNEQPNINNQRINQLMTVDSIEQKRKDMENKWGHLITKNRHQMEEKLKIIRSSSNNSIGFSRSASPSARYSDFTDNEIETEEDINLSQLQEEIKHNRDKLDHIIDLLHSKKIGNKSKDNKGKEILHVVEYLIWTICIVILILCNYYVYKFL
ncbi:hypothetical protein Kpol_1054p22 [Vanderwaltozyma polyspora DSM 70294]|uniref:Uncharacterized protein n=1 Tax=Vanderwaltozyma polyspora (strain ATCC 22028 / DSM 70294 / BCRC 21397 / CBS 2163 / NBRC 10782 / NRRL Y-8283 / UCD 57-17) TaxID=436907 RepID=A7TIA9_VANPO|nr:uncharacterized protein Kpol_1054p22 [Vanderwaltozyma polyspora DSM 70294]EDO17975.1 hypothetical protein Kpol_1054p22 [Vanderwaltozyma polyspora DSM 70294]